MTLTQQDIIELETPISHICQRQAADAFLNGNYAQGEFIGLHRLPEALRETLYRWTFPANVGNTDPTKPSPHGPHSWSPGDPTTFTCQSASSIEDNFYSYMRLPLPAALPTRVADIRTHQIGDLSGWQGLEWQQQLTMGGKIWNMAYQFSYTSGIRIYDKTNEKWIASGIGTSIFPNFTKSVTTICEYALNQNATTHVAITVNGTRYPVGITQAVTPTTNLDKLTVAFQVDPKKGSPCALAISQLDLRYV